MRTSRKIILIPAIILAVLTAGLFYAPGFLAYSTNYGKVDTVVVLLGPVFRDRDRYARDLVNKGMADYLIIPAYDKTYHVEYGMMRLLLNNQKRNAEKKNSILPQYYEDTHLELIKAKKTMEMLGQKSAIFVSSPYHMRRIKLIVDNEFDHRYTYYFSPTPYDRSPLHAWELNASDWKKIWREYTKIAWFMIYSPWTR